MEAEKRAVGALLQLSRPQAVRGQAGQAEGGHCQGPGPGREPPRR